MIKKSENKVFVIWVAISLLGTFTDLSRAQNNTIKWPSHIQAVLDATRPLKFDRGGRLPLYLWQAMDPGQLNEKELEELVKELDRRGVGLISSWNPGDRLNSLAQSMVIAKAQNKLNLRININATRCLYSFFNGDEQTAHIDDKGKLFWDQSFGKKKMGCPFAIDFRQPFIKEQVEYFLKAFKEADLDVDFIFADWEIDGPIEFNEAHAASKRCKRCRENIQNIDDFEEFQRILRKIRCRLQRETFVEPLKLNFPDVLVGNYGIYPHNGYRYWYDYYEYYVDGQSCLTDQHARYRKWYHEFAECGYSFAMPVVYTWRRIFDWYDYEDTDYRWFYNMLLVASNAGQHTSPEIPIISFVHWNTIESEDFPEKAKQFSEAKYQELLWHMLIRGTDTFFLWCRRQEAAKEIELVHQVYSEAQQYGEFLSYGKPICFNVPKQPGTVVSGLQLGDNVLVRRTDFAKKDEAVEIIIDNRSIKVENVPGRCQIIVIR
jgi:hypothetical protein